MQPTSPVFDDLKSRFFPSLAIELREVAKILNVGESTLRNLITSGDLPFPSFKLGKKRLVSLAHLAEHLEGETQSTQRKPGKRRSPRKGTA